MPTRRTTTNEAFCNPAVEARLALHDAILMSYGVGGEGYSAFKASSVTNAISDLTGSNPYKVLSQALRWLRERDIYRLSTSPLAYTPLVEECFLEGEQATRGRLLEGVLSWAIDTLRPGETPSLNAKAWRLYNVLYYPYWEGMTFALLAEEMGLTESALLKNPGGPRHQAITRLVETLRYEMKTSQHRSERQHYTLAARWRGLSPEERSLLALATQVRRPLPRDLSTHLYGITPAADALDQALASLLDRGLLRMLTDSAFFEIHPVLRRYLGTHLKVDERHTAHEQAAHYHEATGDHLEAAYHLLSADRAKLGQAAAHLLITHQSLLLNQQQHQSIAEVLGMFQQPSLPSAPWWYQLKLLVGDVALAIENVSQAVAAYEEAAHSPELATRIMAHYRLGEAQKRLSPGEALVHYDECRQLLAVVPRPSSLMAAVAVDLAWIFLQERRDLVKARKLLKDAQALMSESQDAALEAKLHNGWAGLYAQKDRLHRAIYHRREAYRVAQDSQDRLLRLKMAKNLGFDYAKAGQYERAFYYLHQAQRQAKEAGERQLEGICQKDIGSTYFWQGDYEQAIACYHKAYAIFEEMENLNWLAAVCLDLAEGYATLKKWEEAQQYFSKGDILAQNLDHPVYRAFAEELHKQYPAHLTILNTRQRAILTYVAQQGFITARYHIKQHGCSGRTAHRDLNDLCNRGLLTRDGRARATRYTLTRPIKKHIL